MAPDSPVADEVISGDFRQQVAPLCRSEDELKEVVVDEFTQCFIDQKSAQGDANTARWL